MVKTTLDLQSCQQPRLHPDLNLRKWSCEPIKCQITRGISVKNMSSTITRVLFFAALLMATMAYIRWREDREGGDYGDLYYNSGKN
ncbi:hypothetical protein Y032_0170g279 [Ancylostoma ceylanicum]|uniref:Uncharacterized protein n=1 Tax=Ancylostoma ceylanicum TaxID=53326 RepID=A0A016SW20_9BILA|nr:hypothetical protein Y032_0170g279 [Ancylostoma ceylanicum]